MDPRFADEALRRTPELQYAVQLYQAGYLEAAERHFRTLAAQPDLAEVASYYLVMLGEALSPPDQGRWTLNLPSGAEMLWELDWLRRVFGHVIAEEVIDTRQGPPADRSIIVDIALRPGHEAYYRRNFHAGLRQVMIHLGDERYEDTTSSYRWCRRVYRNIWSPILANLGHVSFFPLGCKKGYFTDAPPAPVAERAHLWSFVGDPNKSSRPAMLEAMRGVPGGFEHLIAGWNSPDSLPTEGYRAVMDQTVFAPCPAGNANLDSFRVYESLEAGCIPIVERWRGYDYFDRLLPGHPMPTISDWSEGRRIVEALGRGPAAERLRRACHDWWEAHKRRLTDDIRADLGGLRDGLR